MAAADSSYDRASALEDFRRARNRAKLREVLNVFSRGSPPQLLEYEDVRRQLRGIESQVQELTEVPLDAIVGSVGRYKDFNRSFLPLHDSDEPRWTAVRQAMTGMAGVPPVELYRIGDAYFVKDGNHRVSVARQLGNKHIHAYVTPLHTRVPLSPDSSPDELIIQAEYTSFLEDTRLDEFRPEQDLTVTVPGQYDELREHISVHHYFMGENEQRTVPRDEAVKHWFDTIYVPVIEAVREHGLLRDFPDRTATDLYLWLASHRGKLWRELGFSLPPQTIASGLDREQAASPGERKDLLRAAARGALPDEDNLVRDLLLALTGSEHDEETFAQALVVAQQEDARLYVLQLISNDVHSGREHAEQQQERFKQLCRRAGVPVQFVITAGQPTEELIERAVWSDLVVTRRPARMTGAFRRFLRRCPSPLLITTGSSKALRHALLAFDGGSRSREALFAVTYLALTWKLEVTVLSVASPLLPASGPLAEAREYLESFGVNAEYVSSHGAVAERIVRTAGEHGCDLIALGSYKFSPWLETMLGGVPEDVLMHAQQAVLII